MQRERGQRLAQPRATIVAHEQTLTPPVDPIASALAAALKPVIEDALREVLAEHSMTERRMPERVDCTTMAQLLDCSPAQIHRLCREEGLPFTRLGDAKRFDPAAVYAWLDARPRERDR